jgi:tripeptide aminopeptidase
MRQRFEEAAARHSVTLGGKVHAARAEVRIESDYDRLNVPEQASIVRLMTGAAQALGRALPTRATGGGSDANVFAARGLEVANLACGMRDIHTVNEWVDLKDLVLTAEILVRAVTDNAAGA